MSFRFGFFALRKLEKPYKLTFNQYFLICYWFLWFNSTLNSQSKRQESGWSPNFSLAGWKKRCKNISNYLSLQPPLWSFFLPPAI